MPRPSAAGGAAAPSRAMGTAGVIILVVGLGLGLAAMVAGSAGSLRGFGPGKAPTDLRPVLGRLPAGDGQPAGDAQPVAAGTGLRGAGATWPRDDAAPGRRGLGATQPQGDATQALPSSRLRLSRSRSIHGHGASGASSHAGRPSARSGRLPIDHIMHAPLRRAPKATFGCHASLLARPHLRGAVMQRLRAQRCVGTRPDEVRAGWTAYRGGPGPGGECVTRWPPPRAALPAARGPAAATARPARSPTVASSGA